MSNKPRFSIEDHDDYAFCERALRDAWLACHPRKSPRVYAVCDSNNYQECADWLCEQWQDQHRGQSTNRGGRPSLKADVEKWCELLWPKPPAKITKIHTLAWLVGKVANKLK